MRKETTESGIPIIEALGNGEWAVRWDFKPKLDEEGKETGVNWYEEEILYHIPQIDEVKELITAWHNKQVDGQFSAVAAGTTFRCGSAWRTSSTTSPSSTSPP